jgi:hypothetical protein
MTRARGPDATQPMPRAIVSADLQTKRNSGSVSDMQLQLPTFRRGADLQCSLDGQGQFKDQHG